jgi:DNA-binding CsgD family transcriptional regulator
MAVEREEEVYIFGNEPFLQPEWRGWSGFVIPFYYHNKEIFGYFSLFSELESIDIQTYPFIKMMALLIETEINTGINKWGGIHFQDYLTRKLEGYKLTPRERQIAVLWMMDYDHKRIGLEMGISENTVRVMTTRLNSKFKVHSKASLILRVLGVI